MKNIKIYILNGVKVDFVNYNYEWIDEIIEEGSFLAKVRNIGSVAALQAYVTKYFDEKK